MANSGTLAVLNVIMGVNARKFYRDLKTVQYKMRRVGRQFKSVGDSISKSFTVPILGAGVAGVKMSSDFSESMSRITGLVGVAREQVGGWKSDLLGMSTEVGKMPRELAEGLFFVTSAGLEGSTALNALRASAQASAAGLGEITTVADAVTSAMNAYDAASLSAGDATGILVAAVREGKASADSIAPALGKVVSVAAEAGVGFDQVAAGISAMTRVGSTASEAATSLRGILRTFLKPSEQTAKALASIGTSAGELRQAIADQGLLSVLDQLKQKFAGNEEGLARVFSETEAYVGVLNLVGDNAGQVRDIFGELATATREDLGKAFETAAAEPAHKLKTGLAGINAAFIRFGEVVTPTVLPVLEQLTGLVDRVSTAFSNLSPQTQNLIAHAAMLAAAVGPLLVVLGGVALTLGTLGGATVAWVAGIAAGAPLIVKHWETVKAAAVAVFDFLKPVLSEIGSVLGEVGGVLKDWATSVWPTLVKAAKIVAYDIGVAWDAVGTKLVAVVKVAWPVVKDVIVTTLDTILTTIDAGLKILTGDWDAAWQTMQDALVRATDRFAPILRLAVVKMKSGLAGLAAGIGASVVQILAQFRSLGEGFLALPFVAPGAKDAVAAALGGINKSIAAISGGIAASTAASQLWDSEAEKIKTSLAGANEKLVKMQTGWIDVPVVAGEAGGAIKDSIGGAIDVVSMKTGEVAVKLSGGFGKAAKEGAATIKQEFTTLQEWAANHPIKLRFDTEDLQRQLNQAGLKPDTSGAVP